MNLTIGTQITSDSVLSGGIGLGPKKAPISIAKPPQKLTVREFMESVKFSLGATQGLLYALLFVFIVTFVVFPAVTFDASLKMLKTLKNSSGWFVLMMNTVFSIFDTVGRKMGGVKFFDIGVTSIKVGAGLRTLFIATFYLIAFQVGPSWMFVSDWFIILNMVVFAFSNGYVSTLCAVKAPGTVEEGRRGQVGSLIGIIITFGIFVGATFAIALTPVLNMTPDIKN